MGIVFAVVKLYYTINVSKYLSIVYTYKIRHVSYEDTSNEFFSLMEHIGCD